VSEMLLLVKRIGLDKTWRVAPYPIRSRDHAERLVEFLQSAWSIPFEHRTTIVHGDHMSEPVCYCGHRLEEHNYYGQRCDVDECECTCFEVKPRANDSTQGE
jgi:hypothetical protein